MKNIWKNFVVLCLCGLFTACSFDTSGVANDDDSDDPVVGSACDNDRECQSDGWSCNDYVCTEGTCRVLDSRCTPGNVCTADGCSEEVSECFNHSDCQEGKICTADGLCESRDPDPVCTSDDQCGCDCICADGACELGCNTDADCCGDGVCNANGLCEPPPSECTLDSECPDHAWSCLRADCSGGTCGFEDTCPIDSTCTEAGCVSPGDVGTHIINCDAVSAGITVTITGNIKSGIVTNPYGDLPVTPTQVSFGSDTNGWPGLTAPNTSLPACDVNRAFEGTVDETWMCGNSFSFGNSVQGFTPYVYGTAHLRYFDLKTKVDGQYLWNVIGHCARGGTPSTEGKLCTCTSLPCTCPW